MVAVEIDILAVIATETGCGLVVLDEDGLVEYWSPQLEEVSGLRADQAVGQLWSELSLPSGVAGSEGPDDCGFGLADVAIVLSGMVFYPVGDNPAKPGRRVGVLRQPSHVVINSEDLPFVVENGAGIPSRKAMFGLLQHQLIYQSRYQTPFALLFLRMKNFSTFVEILGVDNWEITNRVVYDQLSAIVRMVDSVGLYDEATFWMVLANASLDGALVVAEKVKRLTSSMKVDAIDVFLSVAVGGVGACEGEKKEELVQRGLDEVEKALKLPSGISVES